MNSLDPYLVGVLLRSGCLVGGSVGFSSMDVEEIEQVRGIAEGLGLRLKKNRKYEYSLSKSVGGAHVGNPVKAALEGLGLYGKLRHEKFIPSLYLSAPVKTQRELLRGILGDASRVFRSSSYALAYGVASLLDSFGEKFQISEHQTCFKNKHGEKQAGRTSYRVVVCP